MRETRCVVVIIVLGNKNKQTKKSKQSAFLHQISFYEETQHKIHDSFL